MILLLLLVVFLLSFLVVLLFLLPFLVLLLLLRFMELESLRLEFHVDYLSMSTSLNLSLISLRWYIPN